MNKGLFLLLGLLFIPLASASNTIFFDTFTRVDNQTISNGEDFNWEENTETGSCSLSVVNQELKLTGCTDGRYKLFLNTSENFSRIDFKMKVTDTGRRFDLGIYNLSDYADETTKYSLSPTAHIGYLTYFNKATSNWVDLFSVTGSQWYNMTILFDYDNDNSSIYKDGVLSKGNIVYTDLTTQAKFISFSGDNLNSPTVYLDDFIVCDGFTSCNYTDPHINMSFFDEITKEPILNVSYELIFSDYAITGNTTEGFSFLDLNSYGDLEIVYSNDDYYSRKYFVNQSPTETTNVNLYLINKTADNVEEINYLITDQSGVNLQGAKVSVLRRYLDSGITAFEVVEMSSSDTSGQGALHLEKIEPNYKFLVTYDDETILLTGDNQIFQNNIVLKGTVGERITETLYDLQGLEYLLEYNNDTFAYDLTWTDSSSTVDNVCLTINRYLSTGRTQTNNSCSTSSVGSMSLGIGGTTGSYEGVVTVDVGDSTYLLTNLQKKVDSIAGIVEVEGLFWTAIFVVAAATVGVFSPVVSIIFAVVALVISSLIGFASISQGSLIFIGSIAGFIIYSFRRGGA